MNRNAEALIAELRIQADRAASDAGIHHALLVATETVTRALPAIELEARTGQPEPADVLCDCGGYVGYFGIEHEADCRAFQGD